MPGLHWRKGKGAHIISLNVLLLPNTRAHLIRSGKPSRKEKASKTELGVTCKTAQHNSVEETRPARTSREDRIRLLGGFEQIKLIEQLGTRKQGKPLKI